MPKYELTDADVAALKADRAQLARLVKWVKNFKVIGAQEFSNTDDGAKVTIASPGKNGPTLGDPEFWAIIDGHTQDGSNAAWFYGWAVAELADQGRGHFQAKTGGVSGTSTDPDKRAINVSEEINGASGPTGAGVTLPLPDGLTFEPIPDGSPVRMRREIAISGKVQYVITAIGAPNGIDGTCTAPE